MAKRELSSMLKNLPFMQRAALKEEKKMIVEEPDGNSACLSTVAKECVVITDRDPHPGAWSGRMSFQSFNPYIDALARAAEACKTSVKAKGKRIEHDAEENATKKKKKKKKKKKQEKMDVGPWKQLEIDLNAFVEEYRANQFDEPEHLNEDFLTWALKQEQQPIRGGILLGGNGTDMGRITRAISLALEADRQSNCKASGGFTLVLSTDDSLCQWSSEIIRCAPSANVLIYDGSQGELPLEMCDFVVASYTTVQKEFKRAVRKKEDISQSEEKSVPVQRGGLFQRRGTSWKSATRKNPKKKYVSISEEEIGLLHSLEWSRIILDKAHMIIMELPKKTEEAVLALKALKRWALCYSFSDKLSPDTITEYRMIPLIHFLVRFIRVSPFAYYVCQGCECQILDHRVEDMWALQHCSICSHPRPNHFSWWNKYVLGAVKSQDLEKVLILIKRKILIGLSWTAEGETSRSVTLAETEGKMRWERVCDSSSSSSRPGKRWGHTCNAIKGGRFLYVFGGFGKDDCLTNRVHVFDAETQIWTQPVINGVSPRPRHSHSCTTVGDHLFVFGGTDGTNYLKDLHILDTSSHTWICPDVRGEGPEAREAHSATLVDKRIFIFGGCGKSSASDYEVFYNDLYILDTETCVWKRAVTTGNLPFARDSHTCSTWKNKIVVVGGEDLDGYYLSDVHILDTDTFVWKEMNTSGQLLTPRAGHVTIALESNLFVFGGLTDSQNLCYDLYVLDLETGVWSKVVAWEEGPSARFSASAVSLDPYKAGLFFFVGGCNKNLEPLEDIYYLHTGGYDARFDQNLGRLSLRNQMKLKCQWQKLAVARPNIDRGRENLPLNIGSIDQGNTVCQARVTENVPLGYSIETIIDGKMLRGVLFSNRHSSVQTADPSFSSRQRPALSDGNSDHIAKKPRTLNKDSAGSSQQAGPTDPSVDANKKVADSNDMDTPVIDTTDANRNMAGPQEAETAAVTSDVKDQDPSQLDMGIVNNTEPSAITLNQANVETLGNEMSTGIGDAAKAGPGEDSQPQNQGEGTVAAEDANAEQQPQPH